MAEITIGNADWPVYTDVETADDYLAADVQRAAVWATRTTLQKGQGIVSASRLLQMMTWASGSAPSTDDPVDSPLPEATAMLAADILSSPTLASGTGTGSMVKHVKAGPAEVEFFRPTAGTPLPMDVFTLLRSLLGGSGAGLSAYGVASGTDFCSRFDATDYGLSGSYR